MPDWISDICIGVALAWLSGENGGLVPEGPTSWVSGEEDGWEWESLAFWALRKEVGWEWESLTFWISGEAGGWVWDGLSLCLMRGTSEGFVSIHWQIGWHRLSSFSSCISNCNDLTSLVNPRISNLRPWIRSWDSPSLPPWEMRDNDGVVEQLSPDPNPESANERVPPEVFLLPILIDWQGYCRHSWTFLVQWWKKSWDDTTVAWNREGLAMIRSFWE